MGIADIIPGISGGTIAFLLGIYEDLINAIKSFDMKFVRLLCRFQFKEALESVAWQFLGSLFFGIGIAIVVLSGIISWLLSNKPVLVHSFFFGLILATIPIIARVIQKWSLTKILMVVLSAAITYVLVGLVPLETPESLWFLFFSGAIAISAMILPGVSGAFILVLLGKYQYILDAVNNRDIFSLGVFILGIVVGIISFVRVLSWLFSKYHDLTVIIIMGIVAGSLRKIWPWKETVRSMTTSSGKVVSLEQVNILPTQLTGDVILALLLMIFWFHSCLYVKLILRRKIIILN